MNKIQKYISAMLIVFLPAFANSSQICTDFFSNKKTSPAEFLHRKDPKLQSSPFVEAVVRKKDKSALNNPLKKIEIWLKYLDQKYSQAQKYPRIVKRLKESLYDDFIIKPKNVPQSYFNQNIRLARERGYGDIVLTESQKEQMVKVIIDDQKKSLDTWLNYFLSRDTSMYPMWIKYWMLWEVRKLSNFDAESKTFKSRDKGTVAPFIELNREALAIVIDLVTRKLNGESLKDIENPSYITLLEDINFGKLYANALSEAQNKKTLSSSVAGEWIRYAKGSDATPLVNSLRGQNTGWCTAVEGTAKAQLEYGDFYAYYSYDSEGRPTHPRLAIRMEGDEIAEIRGVAKEQNLDKSIAGTNILSDKLKEFGDKGKVFEKKSAHMKLLTEIEKKQKNSIALTKEELTFLYEINEPIIGFGYVADPRVNEIREKRKDILKSDLVLIFKGKYAEHEISVSAKEFLEGGKRFHHGDLNLSQPPMNSKEFHILFENVDIVHGSLTLQIYDAKESTLKMPNTVNGDLFVSVYEVKKLILPEHGVKELYLGYTREVESLDFLGPVESLNIKYLFSFNPEKTKLPKITDYLYINNSIFNKYTEFFVNLRDKKNIKLKIQN